jgi:hypothetical protein
LEKLTRPRQYPDYDATLLKGNERNTLLATRASNE